MLRRAAAKEAHQQNGEVEKNENGYIVKLKENHNAFENSINIQEATGTKISPTSIGWTNEKGGSGTRTSSSSVGTISEARGSCSGTNSCDCGCSGTSASKEGKKERLTLSKIKEKIKESIDKNIEPGLSMSSSGESVARDTGEKIKKYTGKASQVTETIGSGDEMMNSMSDQKEDELKKKCISLTTFKKRNYV